MYKGVQHLPLSGILITAMVVIIESEGKELEVNLTAIQWDLAVNCRLWYCY